MKIAIGSGPGRAGLVWPDRVGSDQIGPGRVGSDRIGPAGSGGAQIFGVVSILDYLTISKSQQSSQHLRFIVGLPKKNKIFLPKKETKLSHPKDLRFCGQMRYNREIFSFLYKISPQRPSSAYSLDFYDYLYF